MVWIDFDGFSSKLMLGMVQLILNDVFLVQYLSFVLASHQSKRLAFGTCIIITGHVFMFSTCLPTCLDVARISLHFFARFFGSYSRLHVQLYFSTSVLQAHQKELDGLQRLLDDHNKRMNIIQQESNQLMNAQQEIEEDKQWDWVVRNWMDV